MVISLVSKSVIGIAILSSWLNSHICSLTYEVGIIILAMAKWESSEIDQLPTFCTDQNSNQKHRPEEIAEVSVTIKSLKDVRVMVSPYLHLVYLGGPSKKQMNTGI